MIWDVLINLDMLEGLQTILKEKVFKSYIIFNFF
jgi:hypothetical protein